jgi:HEPN domain-containing protein
MSNNEIVNEWIKFAKRDYDSAVYLDTMHPKPYEIICFLCQQASEKILKGYLIYFDITPPKTHELKILCEMCKDRDRSFAEIEIESGIISTYGVQPRYPYEIEINEDDTRKALECATKIINFVTRILNEK